MPRLKTEPTKRVPDTGSSDPDGKAQGKEVPVDAAAVTAEGSDPDGEAQGKEVSVDAATVTRAVEAITSPAIMANQSVTAKAPSVTADLIWQGITASANFGSRVIDGIRDVVTPTKTNYINDERFITNLDKLKDLRSFFLQEAISVANTDALSFGDLNPLRFSSKGRAPTVEEWFRIEWLTRELFSSLTEASRTKYRLSGVPWIIALLPIIFIILALTSMTFAILGTQGPLLGFSSPGANVLPFYLIWLISLGSIGAVAFIGMNALLVQEDITFDLTNRRLMLLRVVLGGLFGLVLTLPFGFQGFLNFCVSIGVPFRKRTPQSQEIAGRRRLC